VIATSVLFFAAQGLAAQPVAVSAAISPAAIAPASCLEALRAIDAGDASRHVAVDGSKIKKSTEISKLRKSTAPVQTLMIDGGNFTGQSFKGNFPNICFRGSNLTGTRWTKASAPGVGFVSANLSDARLDRATLNHVLFRNTLLVGANARESQLSDGQLDGGWDASVERLDLSNASMRGFKFICGETATDGCPFNRRGLKLENADLSGARIHSFGLLGATLKGVVVNKTEIGLDHIGQLTNVIIAGPVIVRSERQSVQLTVGQFDALRSAAYSAAAAPTNCVKQETRLRELICNPARGDLAQMERENLRLYATMVPGAVLTSPAQEAFLENVSACTSLTDDAASECIKVEFEARREVLVEQLIARKPLMRREAALYVSQSAPFLRVAVSHTAVRPIAPILADSSRAYLLVKVDEQGNQDALAVGTDAAGNRCVANHFRSAARATAPKRGMTARIWATGADYLTFAGRMNATLRYERPCPAEFESGPLVRIAVNPADFDKMYAEASAAR
jgi:uncharacterized protein YjbI with pentapeptide repeats